jgi:hypothetical protein
LASKLQIKSFENANFVASFFVFSGARYAADSLARHPRDAPHPLRSAVLTANSMLSIACRVLLYDL